jgi:membrane-associated phospholipid phosphatase
VVLPCLLAATIWLVAVDDRRTAAVWLGWLTASALATLASKVAFIGWGIGIASLDFTGVSGHTLMAASVWPVLLSRVASRRNSVSYVGMALVGYALALLVAISRLMLSVHSPSEVVAGFVLGSLVSAAAVFGVSPARHLRPGLLSLALALWLIAAPIEMPKSRAHGLVVQIALHLSKHAQPHQRDHPLARLGWTGFERGPRLIDFD